MDKKELSEINEVRVLLKLPILLLCKDCKNEYQEVKERCIWCELNYLVKQIKKAQDLATKPRITIERFKK